MLLGVFDESAYIIIGSLTRSTQSFSELLSSTNLPKSSLYVTLMKLVENGLVIRNGAYFVVSNKGDYLYKTFYEIIEKGNLPQPKIEITREEQKESAISKLFNGIKKMFGR